jgi:hypothetical protein
MVSKLNYFVISILSLSLLTFSGFSVVSAQENEEVSSLGIEEIIVTARKRENLFKMCLSQLLQ